MNRFFPVGLIAVIFSSCGPAPAASDLNSGAIPVGQFHGYESMSSFFRQKLLDADDPRTDMFELGIFLGTRDPASLPALLGGFSGDGADNGYRNGVPNAMNSAVWYLVMQRLAGALASYCIDPASALGGSYKLNPALESVLTPVCAWPATPPEDLDHLWQYVVGYHAPESEKAVWKQLLEEFRSAVPDDAPGKWLTKTSLETMFLNPYFLLKQ